MQNLQVPVWLAVVVTLGVAAIGAVGPITAQFVSAWREKERETVKWKREKITLSARLRFEHADQWRQSRIQSYGRYVTSLFNLQQILLYVRDSGQVDAQKIWMDYNYFHLPNLKIAVNEIEIIGSAEMLSFLDARRVDTARLATPPLLIQGFDMAGRMEPANKTEVVELLEILMAYRRDFLAVARKELALTTPHLDDLD